MSKKHTSKMALFAGVTALAALAPNVHAQSSDALIDKLLQKGILSADEAKDLREESDKDFKTAFQAKTGMPDWVTGYKISGDFRGRYESINADAAQQTTRDRFRYRLRAGLTVMMQDDLEAGFRLTSDEASSTFGGDPISGNTTMSSNGSKKFVFIDQAYGKWSPLHANGLDGSVTIGKMENPFVASDIVFDPDYTPEGAALQLGYAVTDKQSLRFNGGGFSLNELPGSSYDAYLFGSQVRWDAKWAPKLATSFGVSYFDLMNSANLVTTALTTGAVAVPDSNTGNWRDSNTKLLSGFNPFVVDAAVTYTLDSFPFYDAAFPIKLAGDVINNPSASDANNTGWSAGVTFGKAGKKGLWEVSYRYKYLEANAWYEELVDSDSGAFYGAAYHNSPTGTIPGYKTGTNVKGHVIKATYNVTDSLALGVSYMLMDLIDRPVSTLPTTTGRLQVDASLKF
jgi:hypothetical protein